MRGDIGGVQSVAGDRCPVRSRLGNIQIALQQREQYTKQPGNQSTSLVWSVVRLGKGCCESEHLGIHGNQRT